MIYKLQAKKILEYNRNKERCKEEKELKARQERIRRAQEAREKEQVKKVWHGITSQKFISKIIRITRFAVEMKLSHIRDASFGGCLQDDLQEDERFGGSGMPNMPKGFEKVFQDSEVLSLLQDKDVLAAYMDIINNPANIAKHMSNPKVMKLFSKIGNASGGFGMKSGNAEVKHLLWIFHLDRPVVANMHKVWLWM